MAIIIIIISGQYTSRIDPFGKQKHARYLANEIKRELEAVKMLRLWLMIERTML